MPVKSRSLVDSAYSDPQQSYTEGTPNNLLHLVALNQEYQQCLKEAIKKLDNAHNEAINLKKHLKKQHGTKSVVPTMNNDNMASPLQHLRMPKNQNINNYRPGAYFSDISSSVPMPLNPDLEDLKPLIPLFRHRRQLEMTSEQLDLFRSVVCQQNQQIMFSRLLDRVKHIEENQRWGESSSRVIQPAVSEQLPPVVSRSSRAEYSVIQSPREDAIPIPSAAAARREFDRIKSKPSSELEADVSEIDWEHIAQHYFKDASPMELEFAWERFCNPAVNRSPWTAEEDRMLVKLALEAPESGWDQISSSLGTKRSGFACLKRYVKLGHECSAEFSSIAPVGPPEPCTPLSMKVGPYLPPDFPPDFVIQTLPTRFISEEEMPKVGTLLFQPSDNLKTSTGHGLRVAWQPEEDAALRSAVSIFGERNWQQVSTMLSDRCGQQCLHRWYKTLKPSIHRGKWTKKEDLILLLAYKAYEKPNWKAIQQYIPGRTDMQCRERYVNVLNTGIKCGAWTPEEDAKLRRLVEEFGPGKWSKIAAILHKEGPIKSDQQKDVGLHRSRTDSQCARRWKVLYRRIKEERN